MSWKEKLTSRKLWLTVANLVAMIILNRTGNEDVAVQVSTIIMGAGGVIAYVFAQAWCDSKEVENDDGWS